MSGLKFYNRQGGVFPVPPVMDMGVYINTTINPGDIIVATKASTTATTVRPLAAADKTAHYLVSSADAGIWGVALDGIITNASGMASAMTPYGGSLGLGGTINELPGMGASLGIDPSDGQQHLRTALAMPDAMYAAKLDSTSAIGVKALIGTKCGIIISTVNGQNSYTIDTNAAAADQIATIVGVDEQDPFFGQHGATVMVQFLLAYSQIQNGVLYAS